MKYRCALRRVAREEARTWIFVALVLVAFSGLRFCGLA